MKKYPCLASLLAAAVTALELTETSEVVRLIRKAKPTIGSASSDWLASSPHTHNDIEVEEDGRETMPSLGTGTRSEDVFQLSISPRPNGTLLIASPSSGYRPVPNRGLPTLGEPEWIAETQHMYRLFRDVEELIDVLGTNPEFPQGQLDAIRRNASAPLQVIGGYAATRIWRRRYLEGLGMNYRPPDC